MRTTIIIAAAILLTACGAKDPTYNTEHPEHGKITLTTDWSARGDGIDIPSSYAVEVGKYSTTLSGLKNVIDNLFDPGDYTVYVHNTADNIALNGITVTANYFAGALGWLFTGRQDIEVKKDTEHELTVAMAQQVRELTFIIAPTGGTADKIESITATLSGAAGTLDIDSGTHGKSSDIALTFTKITEGADAGKWSATVRLLGITGSVQRLTGTITFTNGDPAAVSLDSDLTTALADFNADKEIPLTLGGTIVETPTGAGFTASITEWNVVQGDEIIAD